MKQEIEAQMISRNISKQKTSLALYSHAIDVSVEIKIMDFFDPFIGHSVTRTVFNSIFASVEVYDIRN